MLNSYRYPSLALLMGFMVGSLKKVWPWKIVAEPSGIVSAGKTLYIEKNVLPFTYEVLTRKDSFLFASIVLLIVGLATVLFLEKKSSVEKIKASELL